MRIIPNRRSRSGSRKRYDPAIGTEFEIEEVSIIEAKTRGFVAKNIVILAAGAITVTGGYGLLNANYVAVEVVWAAAGPIIGAVIAYYFALQRKDSG
jgi:hypothetical protein